MTAQEFTKFKCDQCGAVDETPGSNPAPGWKRLGTYADFCSWACLAKYAGRWEAEEAQKAKQVFPVEAIENRR